jgi:hypothetical protein
MNLEFFVLMLKALHRPEVGQNVVQAAEDRDTFIAGVHELWTREERKESGL